MRLKSLTHPRFWHADSLMHREDVCEKQAWVKDCRQISQSLPHEASLSVSCPVFFLSGRRVRLYERVLSCHWGVARKFFLIVIFRVGCAVLSLVLELRKSSHRVGGWVGGRADDWAGWTAGGQMDGYGWVRLGLNGAGPGGMGRNWLDWRTAHPAPVCVHCSGLLRPFPATSGGMPTAHVRG